MAEFKFKRANVIIVSSPSGVGKTTVTNKLLKKIKNSSLSISCTTRKPREKEFDKRDYYFVNKKQFVQYQKKNKFLETEKVFGNSYGTLKSEVFDKIKSNKTVFLDVDWRGARSIKKKLNNKCISIFLLPPSIKILKQRLLRRHYKNKKLGLKRFFYAKRDIKYWNEYDYIFVNNDLNKCVNQIYKKIIEQKNNDLNKIKIETVVKKLLKSKLN